MSSWAEVGSWDTTSDTASVRNVFTTIAVVLNLCITLIGGYFLKRSNQRTLLRKSKDGHYRTVPVTHLASWQSLGGIASYIWQLRRLPGGRYGMLMIWTGIFSLAHQYFINSFILSETMSGPCTFNQGIVTTNYNGSDLVPAATWPVSVLVYDAFLAAEANGGVMGIWNVIDAANYANFKPRQSDLLGNWNCTQKADSSISPTDWETDDALDSWIDNEGFVYNNWYRAGSQTADRVGDGFLVWGASSNDSDTQWNLRATIATPLTGNNPVNTSNYECDLVKLKSSWAMPWMEPQATLKGWGSLSYGIMRGADVDEYGTNLEYLLNAMMIITGSGNHRGETLPSGTTATYGCTYAGTKIGPEMFLLLGTLFVVLLLLIVADIYALVAYRLDEKHTRVQEIPLGYIDWQLAAVRLAVGSKISAKDLAEYEYGWNDDKDALAFVRGAASEDVSCILWVDR